MRDRHKSGGPSRSAPALPGLKEARDGVDELLRLLDIQDVDAGQEAELRVRDRGDDRFAVARFRTVSSLPPITRVSAVISEMVRRRSASRTAA